MQTITGWFIPAGILPAPALLSVITIFITMPEPSGTAQTAFIWMTVPADKFQCMKRFIHIGVIAVGKMEHKVGRVDDARGLTMFHQAQVVDSSKPFVNPVPFEFNGSKPNDEKFSSEPEKPAPVFASIK